MHYGGGPDLDLKSKDFQKIYEPHWFEFTLTEQDKRTFDVPGILSIKGDEIASYIFEHGDSAEQPDMGL